VFLFLWLPLIASGRQDQSAVPVVGDFPKFTDVAQTVGVTLENISGGATKDYIVESLGNGAAFLDYDSDGDSDLLITNGSTMEDYLEGGHPMAALYENVGERFENITDDVGISATGWGVGICVADYDNDGHSDFYLTAYGSNILYRNTGDDRFEDRTSEAGIGDALWSTNCAFADYDRDGNVDLYVSNYVDFDPGTVPQRGEIDRCRYMGAPVFCGPLDLPGASDTLYRNNGDGSFSDVTQMAGIEDPGSYGLGMVFSDFDNDGWPDLYVANDSVPNFMFHNNQDGTFSDVSLISGTALSEDGVVQSGMGIGIGDYDRNGYFDIFVTNFARDTNTLYRNAGNMFFTDVTALSGLGEVSRRYLGWGTGLADLDNDGLADIFVANGHVYPEVDRLDIGQAYSQPKEVYRNMGNGRFEELSGQLGGDLPVARPARGTAFGDYDNDGDIDVIAINMDTQPSLYRNDGGSGNNWINFRLEGTESNRDAIGARVEIDVGSTTQVAEVRSGGSYLSHNDMRIHFGLARALTIDEVRIRWPSGQTEVLTDINANQFVHIREGEGIVPVNR
jgi:hypothetical protein